MIAQIPIHRITREVLERNGVTIDQLREQNRAKGIVRVRQELSYLLRETKLYTWQKIASHICRDHKTVVMGYRAHKRRNAL